jgi:hypothetical protein
MKLHDTQMNADSLAELGADAVHLLCRGDIGTLAGRFGYALSYGREPATAIREDLRSCLSKIGAASLATGATLPVPTVVFYKGDVSNLIAIVECQVPADNGATVLVELVVTTDGTERHITLEDVSDA